MREDFRSGWASALESISRLPGLSSMISRDNAGCAGIGVQANRRATSARNASSPMGLVM